MELEIYLDNSATTRQYNEVTELIADVSANKYGNPSSLHTKGIEAEKLAIKAREAIASTIGADPTEIYFTSGGTESNNLAIIGYLEANPRKGSHILTTKIEHPSVLEVYHHLETKGWRVDYIDVDENGIILLDQLEEKVCSETALISVMLVNNETGSIQPISDIVSIRNAKNPRTVIHVDAVQAYGKMEILPEKEGIALMSISSHKIHGPKGVGALYVSKRIKINPLFYGGGQETLLRSGTENVPGIAGFGLAAEMIWKKREENYNKASLLRQLFIEKLSESGIVCSVNSHNDALPYIVNVSFGNVRSEVLLHHLEQRGIFVSTGSACSSNKKNKSHVLSAMNIPSRLIDGAVRFSFSGHTTQEEIILTVEALKDIIPIIDINRNRKIGRKQ